jgi:hypothetical protein
MSEQEVSGIRIGIGTCVPDAIREMPLHQLEEILAPLFVLRKSLTFS